MNDKIMLIANPASNKGRTKDIVPVLKRCLERKKIAYRLFMTDYPQHAISITNDCCSDFSHVIAIGGDGTFNEVLNGLAGKNIPMGFVCAGSGNDFGKTIVKDMNIEEQLELALNGTLKKIDVGMCNGRYFINGIGIGFDGKVVQEILKRGKRGKGHWIYMSVVLKQILTYKEQTIELRTSDISINKPVFMVTIGNGTTFGGGFRLTPDALLDDGLFDICLILPLGIFERYIKLLKVLKGTHINDKVVRTFRAAGIMIQSGENVIAHMDGEFFGTGPFDIKILPSFLPIHCQ
ncbi:diacylglycerol/lipid kinase family protein [Elusimicrobiota bacterium]